jgi:hypothetical protein
MAFNKKDLAEQLKMMEKQGEMQSKLNDSMSAYVAHMNKIAELQKNISHIQEQVNISKEKEKGYVEELGKLLADRHKGSKKEQANRKVEIKLILDKAKAERAVLKINQAQLAVLEETNDEYVTAAQNVNKVNLGLKEGLKFLEKTPGLIKKGYGKLKGYGVFEMDKSIRMAGVEMGKLADVSTAFGRDIIKASTETQSMGMHVKDLAKMQASYSSELGRSVMLSEEGFDAMSQMAKGTILGAEGAASLAAEMDSFNISAIGTKNIIEDTTNMAEKMGLNASKVIKTLQNNLKMANKYHFKGGVKGMVKMAAEATKFGMSMETTAGFADKLFNIEGAVEMAAKLNTMGGEWSKLGDPMKLMYQARNDMEGLQTSVIDATAGMADFNKETGEFSFSGLELHRMRELEKITGISAEEMANMAKSKAKFAKIGGQMGIDVAGDPVMADFIENSATWNSDKKTFEVKLSGEKDAIPVKELTESHKKMMKADAANLKKRAENSQSFDDQLINMIENLKTLLLPLLEGMNKQLPKMIEGFKSFMKDTNGIAASLKGVAKTIGGIVGGAIKLFMTFPKTISAIALLLMGPGKWILNGLSLASGFMMGTRGMGMGGGGGGGGGMMRSGAGGAGGKANMMRHPAGKVINGKKVGGQMYNAGPKGGRFKMSGGAKMGAGLGLGLAGMGVDAARGGLDDRDSSLGKAMGVGSSALTGAAMGMMLGPVGALVGGILGAAYGAFSEYGGPEKGTYDPTTFKPAGDIMSPAKGITKISTKEGGLFNPSKNDDIVAAPGAIKAMQGGGSSNIKISFDDILVKSDDGSTGKIDLENDSAFMAQLATKIKESMSMTANGGVLNPNPS